MEFLLKSNSKKSINIIAIIVFLLGCTGLVAAMVLDKLYWGTHLLAEGWPDFSLGHIIRSIIIFISILAIFWSFIGIGSDTRPCLRLDESSGLPLEKLSILGVLSISVVIIFLFIFKPPIFNVLSLEDGIIEWGSATLLFGSCIVTVFYFVKSHYISHIPKSTRFSIALLSLVFFVMAMEEVSWFQRVLEIETPKEFEGNIQNEMNLHNFYTNPIENIYYFGSFLFLVVLPFVRLLFPFITKNNYLRIFVARPFIGIIGSVACAYNFDMWNIVFTQIAFFGSLVILFSFYVFSSKRNEKLIISFTTLIFITTQVLFLINGVNFARLWEVTEYKEFFIPLAFFIYSLDLSTHMNEMSAEYG